MQFLKICYSLIRRKSYNRNSFGILTTVPINYFKSKCISKELLTTNTPNAQLIHTENDDNEELFENFPILETEKFERHIRSSLLKNSDKIIQELSRCTLAEEVLSLVKKYINVYESNHVLQTIFVLRDMQIVFERCHGLSGTKSNKFIEHLYKNEEFDCLLSFIDNNLNSFEPECLSYMLLYLNKLGISIEDHLMQAISLRVRNHLLDNFSLDECSRFLEVIFTENSVRPYYMTLNIIPTITSQIDKCETAEDLGYLTVCLNKLHKIVTYKLLAKYKEKTIEFLKNKKLKATDYSTLLKIIMFLNYPEWRNENVGLTSDCILLLKTEINSLTVNELIILYEIRKLQLYALCIKSKVFFKNQEPGDILNDLQRCSVKFLQQLEETESSEISIKLKLFSSLIYFSSPIHRVQFRKDIEKYSKTCSNYNSLFLLRRLFSYVKISDAKLCANYWNLSLKLLCQDESTNNVLKLCQNYMYFNIDIESYRHYKCERRIMRFIEESVREKTVLFPATISGYLSFAMVYGKNGKVLKLLIEKFAENLTQFSAVDCLKLSHGILLLADNKNTCISPTQIKTMKKLLNKCTEYLLEVEDNNFSHNSMLLKASVLRKDFDNIMTENLLMKYKEMEYMSSKMIEHIYFIFLMTSTLIPEVINKCTEYVIKNRNNVLAFNAEKILHLCYYLAYYPINAERFFDVVTDIIIRDRERLSGLAFIQSALSLCFFNKLPSSFIKQIFNVEFLEKLDVELANCYSKDKYPQKVRTKMMQLNRAVCLDYPEANVPWFHKKFVDEFQKKFVNETENYFPQRVKQYLIEVLGKPQYISENILTPYGYHIDFVVNLNNKEEVVSPNSTEINRRVALLLLQQHAFTRFYTHLKGKYQFKRRHLEMFGYGVAIIHFNEWINLLYAEERLEYLSKLIWPDYLKSSINVHKSGS
ncbi:hypothetical protein NQ314_015117 [Rhamnusium bicolor]|uniref:RAP domain-containing protein n=1 Tax=Rhamnusium bicolor TaxID=1586634 RepID=A0AAV8WZM3_9CUCU|nr:hypothetical protein NQ314_015117 [Rhamnusium bicolor]